MDELAMTKFLINGMHATFTLCFKTYTKLNSSFSLKRNTWKNAK